MGSIPGPGTKIPYASVQLSLSTTNETRGPSAFASWQVRTVRWGACALQWESSPCPLQLEKACTATKTQHRSPEKILVHSTVLNTKADKKKQNTSKNVIYTLITFMKYKDYIFKQSQKPQLVHMLVNL